jgi:putative membrane protein
MVTWFAGLFYLPRLFIYHAQAGDAVSRARFTVMEGRLFAIMTIGALLTTVFGASLIFANQVLLQALWLQLKLALAACLFVYHYRCYRWITVLRDAESIQNTKWLRWFNEIPGIFLLGMVFLAVLKPF